MEYSSDFKKNHATGYLAEEYERLALEKAAARSAAGADPALHEMADEDATRIGRRQAEILEEIAKILNKEKEEEAAASAVVLELRAGAGGDEATLFAKTLKEMYLKYAEMSGWSVKVLDELTLEIDGR